VATGTAWTVLLAAVDTSSEGPKCPCSRVLQGLGALAKPGAKRQTLVWCLTIAITFRADSKSGRGQPHSKTLARPPNASESAKRFGVRLSSAALDAQCILNSETPH